MKVEVKCLKCMEVFKQTENPPGPHDIEAGVADGKMMYNTKCPNCGTLDMMGEKYVGVPDDILRTYREKMIENQKNPHRTDVDLINAEKFVQFQNGELSEQDLRDKLDIN